MPSIINASTSGAGGVITTADASGQLELQTAGTTAVTVNSSQVASFANAPVMGVSGLTGDIAAARITNALNATGSAPIYACRAWVNFNGTGTVAIRASGNVSSITDNGVGDYTVNFTTAMPDANYSPSLSVRAGGRYPVTSLFTSGQTTAANPTASAFRITIGDTSAASLDSAYVCLSVFR